jgi:hypothetical protein
MVDTPTNDTQRSAFTTLDKGSGEFNVPPAILSSKITDGGTYIVIARGRQGDVPQMWSTGDQEQTQHLFDQYTRQTA